MPSTNVDGLVSGLDTTALISQLMQLERQPQLRLQARQTAITNRATVYQTLNTRMAAVRDAAASLSGLTSWQAMKATTSSDSVTASAKSTALPGLLTFTVDRLASAHSVVTLAGVSSTSASILPADSGVLLSRAGSLGVGSLSVTAGSLAAGDYHVTVTQSSSGATVTGEALGAAVTIGAGAQLRVALDAGGAEIQVIDLAEGTYSRSALAEMITTASGGTLQASITRHGELALATVREGSAAHLKVQADTDAGVLSALNLTTASTQPAVQGTDGKITVGDSAEVTVTDTGPAATAAIVVGGATVTSSFSAGLRAGSVTAKQVSTGDGSLAAVVSAVNGANAGMTAAAVQVSPGLYKLQIASKTTGLSGALTFEADAFGATENLTQAADAQLTVGGTLRITSATNTFTDVLPGVTLTATHADPAAPVTLNVASDAGALADKVAKLVEGVNGVFSYVKLQGSYNADTKAAGPLLGDALARRVTGDLYRQLGAPGVDLREVGLSLTKEGFLSFDRAAFLSAYEQDPAAVEAFFHDKDTTDTADDGLGKRLEAMAKAATDSVGGLITDAIKGRQSEASRLERQVADWDVRLARRESTLRRQFAGLETALANLRNQSTWLAGQLSGLVGSSS